MNNIYYECLNSNKLTKDINLNDNEVIHVKIICYHINVEGTYPFLQFMLYNSYNLIPFLGALDQTLIFPFVKCLFEKKKELNDIIINKIKDYLINLGIILFHEDHIVINGFYNYNNENYVLINISDINIDVLLLNNKSEIWFGLTNEICNESIICKLQVNKSVNLFFLNNKEFITLIKISNKKIIKTPFVVYDGNNLKRIEFQSIFGKSKSNKIYGYYFYFNPSFDFAINNCFKNNLFNDEMIEIKEFNQIAGINRIALLSDKILYIDEEQILEKINIDELDEFINDYDTIFIKIPGKDPVIIIKEFIQQIQLSYHKVSKNLNNKICIV